MTTPEQGPRLTATYVHRWIPGAEATLLLLHGTGGNEDDLLPLGQALMPGAAILAPRGNVLEGRMPRFFRRLAEGVFDLPDLERRTGELAAFVRASSKAYQFDPALVTAVGFSNGANIAASLLLREPRLLQRAVLFRAMLPFEPTQLPALAGTRVYLGAGRTDSIVPQHSVERLATILRDGGAEVTLEWQPGGHDLTAGDIERASQWLAE